MGKRIKITAVAAICILVILQISALFIFTGSQIEDSGNYRELAIEKARQNSFYPDENDEYSRFIANPGLINYLSVFYRISDSDKLPIAGNIILVMIMAACIFYIAKKLFKSNSIAYISIILLAIFPTFIGEILNLRSEILFSTLAYGAIAVFLSNFRFKYITCGILLALANWVRPLGLVFLVAIIIYMILTKVKLKNYIRLVSAVVCIVLLLGTASFISSGYFIFQSSTGGVNFIMGANDDADGSFNTIVFREGHSGYIEDYDNLTFKEKDSIWVSQSLDWIKQNPMKYIALIPAKIYYMYAVDTYAFSTFYNNELKTSGSEYISPLVKNLLQFNFGKLTWVDYVVILNQLLYMAFVLLFILSSIIFLFKKRHVKEIFFLLGILLLGTGMTILTVGGARYHYPYLPVFFILAAALINEIINKKESSKTTSETGLQEES